MFEMMAEAHLTKRLGSLMAMIVRSESLSTRREEQPWEEARLVAKRVACAFPRLASIWGVF